MQFLNKIASKIDSTVKYLFLIEGTPVEFSYINKRDGKDIICSPSQTSCKMGCTFCHLTGRSEPVINIRPTDMFSGVRYIIEDLRLPRAETLLISYMGAGDPLNNYDNVIVSMHLAQMMVGKEYRNVRFAVASIMPSANLMRAFIKRVIDDSLNVKFHLSLHETTDAARRALMPRANTIESSLDLLEDYTRETYQPVEIHYTLIDGVNDTDEDMSRLVVLLRGRGIPVKFLAFKPKADERRPTSTERVAVIREYLEHYGDIRTEFYDPPGSDIGASCGQFLQNIQFPLHSNFGNEEITK